MAEAPHPAMNLPTMMIQTAEAPAITTHPISSQGYKTYYRRQISKLDGSRYYLCFRLSACTLSTFGQTVVTLAKAARLRQAKLG